MEKILKASAVREGLIPIKKENNSTVADIINKLIIEAASTGEHEVNLKEENSPELFCLDEEDFASILNMLTAAGYTIDLEGDGCIIYEITISW